MRGGTRGSRPHASVPAIGPWVPTGTLRVIFFAVAAGLCVLVHAHPFWLVVGLLLAAGTTLAPDRVPAWWLLLLLALSQIWREPSVTDPTFYLLLAGVHLLHVLGGLARLLPWMGRLQLRALVSPLRRFVLVQTVSQAVAVGALLAFGGGPGSVTGLSILAAGALAIVAAVLARQASVGSPSPPSQSRRPRRSQDRSTTGYPMPMSSAK